MPKGGNLLHHLELAAVLQVSGDAGRAKAVAADLRSNAGVSPTRTPESRQRAEGAVEHVPIEADLVQAGNVPALNRHDEANARVATNKPNTPAVTASVRLSASNWRTIRVRLAPGAPGLAADNGQMGIPLIHSVLGHTILRADQCQIFTDYLREMDDALLASTYRDWKWIALRSPDADPEAEWKRDQCFTEIERSVNERQRDSR